MGNICKKQTENCTGTSSNPPPYFTDLNAYINQSNTAKNDNKPVCICSDSAVDCTLEYPLSQDDMHKYILSFAVYLNKNAHRLAECPGIGQMTNIAMVEHCEYNLKSLAHTRHHSPVLE